MNQLLDFNSDIFLEQTCLTGPSLSVIPYLNELPCPQLKSDIHFSDPKKRSCSKSVIECNTNGKYSLVLLLWKRTIAMILITFCNVNVLRNARSSYVQNMIENTILTSNLDKSYFVASIQTTSHKKSKHEVSQQFLSRYKFILLCNNKMNLSRDRNYSSCRIGGHILQ